MSIPIRGLAVFRPLNLNRILCQGNRTFSLGLRRENTSLRFTNASYAFPLSPQSQIQPDGTSLSHAAFLEEPSEEYGHLEDVKSHGADVVRSPAAQAAEVILRLIVRGEMDKALAARDEFVNHGVQIARNPAFATAAIADLSIVDPGTRSKRFIAWWSLVPLDECPEQLDVACTRLMNHPFDIPLLMDFCILCARAGHVREVERSRLFPHIFRYGHPNATTGFLVKLEHEARKHCRGDSTKPWMSLRNSAIRMHLLAGRQKIATELYKGAVANRFEIDAQTLRLLEANDSTRTRPTEVISTAKLQSRVPKDRHRSVSELAQELRILRRIVASRARPPHFERFLAEFIDAYESLGRKSRAIRMLRKRVFKDATFAVAARWIAGEQMAYSMRKRPLAILRTFINYCLADNILNIEARRVLSLWRERKRTQRKEELDWLFSRKAVKVDWKIWPSNASISLAWKALLQLSQKNDIHRLYALFLRQVEAARLFPGQLANGLSSTSDTTLADKHYYDASSHAVVVPPAVFPDTYYFHHFVVALATKCSPRYGAQAIRDMQRLGVPVTMDSWGALAGAYARSGDVRRVLRVLDHLESGKVPVSREPPEKNRGGVEWRNENSKQYRSLVATYNSVLRGFVDAAMYPEARSIRRRMQDRGFIREGLSKKDRMDKRTRSKFHRLSRYERGLYDRVLYHPKRKTVVVGDRRLLLDDNRVDWLKELEV